MKKVLSLLLVLVVASAFGQGHSGDEPIKKELKEVKTTSAPVNHAEAKAVFEKAWKALVIGLKVKGTNPVKLPADTKPITKNEVLGAFKVFVQQAKPLFKRSATKVSLNTSRLRKDLDQASFGKLIEDGFVMPVGPLVIGKDGTVSTHDFGDAVGVMLLRIADLAHLPMRRFSPALMPVGG